MLPMIVALVKSEVCVFLGDARPPVVWDMLVPAKPVPCFTREPLLSPDGPVSVGRPLWYPFPVPTLLL